MDPLTVKELQGLSRNRITYLSRGLYVGLFGLVLYLWWATHIGQLRSLSPSRMANLGRQLFNGLAVLQLVLVGMGAIIGSADMIHREIRSRTLAMVVGTPLSGAGIVWAKWKATMVQATALMLCGLPTLAACVYLGAIGPWEMAWSTGLTLALAAIGAALGLRHAVTCKTTGGAAFLALLELSAPALLLLMLSAILPPVATLLIFLHPVGAFVGVATPGLAGTGAEYGWMVAMLASVLASLWLNGRTGAKLLDLGTRIEEPNPDLTEDRGLLVAGAAVRSWVTETRVWDDQPLLWKELATRPGVRLEGYIGKPLLWGTLAMLVFMWLATGGISLEFLIAVEALVLVAVVMLGAGLFTRDRETRWNEMVLCTPLSSFELLRAKLLSGLLAPESLYVLSLGAVVLVAWTLPLGLLPCFFAVPTAVAFAGFAYLLAAFCSLLGRSIRGSFIWAAGLLSLVFVIFPYHSVWLDQRSLYGARAPWRFEDSLLSLNPVIFLHSSHSFGWQNLEPERPWHALLTFMGAYASASILLMAAIGWTYRRMRCRGQRPS